jgi:hypothetical protein
MAIAAKPRRTGIAFEYLTAFVVRPSPDDAMRIYVFLPGIESPAILSVSGSSELPILL